MITQKVRLPSIRRRLATIPPVAARRLPKIHIGDEPEPFPVDGHGLVVVGRQCDRITLPPDPSHIAAMAEWLRMAEPITTPRVSSYQAKHIAAVTHGYASNGAFIVAAFLLGFPLSQKRPDSPNVLVGISRRWLRSLGVHDTGTSW